MRAIVTGLVACGALLPAGVAAAGAEWVVLRVERVEVAVARADGSPWDDGSVERDECQLEFNSALSIRARQEAKRLCVASAGHDSTAPDLFIRLLAGGTGEYTSGVARNATAHQFEAGFLIPLEAVGAEGVSLEVGDQDGPTSRRSEMMGTVELSLKDIKQLLARSSRLRTFADRSITRMEVTARRYRPARPRVIQLDPGAPVSLIPTGLIAGEFIEIRARHGIDAVAVLGGRLAELSVGRCVRTIAASSGGLMLAIDELEQDSATIVVSARKPLLRLWRRAVPRIECLLGGKAVSAAAVTSVQVRQAVTPSEDDVRTVVAKRYLQGIRRCHERGLRLDPTAFGPVRLIFRILSTGAASSTNVGGFDSTIDTCIESLISKWRFAVPKDASGSPSFADVDMQLSL